MQLANQSAQLGAGPPRLSNRFEAEMDANEQLSGKSDYVLLVMWAKLA